MAEHFEHAMLREIYEQPEAIAHTLARYVERGVLREAVFGETATIVEQHRDLIISASGSSRLARRAGYQPKNTPTAAAKTKPPTTEGTETSVGQCASADSTFEVTIPSAMPATPPRISRLTAAAICASWR